MVHPLYNYGPPVVVNATGTPAVIVGAEVEPGTSTVPHTPPANTGNSAGSSGSPSEELLGMYTPALDSISPSTAVHGGADLTLTCTGTNFFPATSEAATSVYFNNGKEATTYVSPTSVTTTVKPSLVASAIAVPVTVKNLGLESVPQTFTFT